VYFKLRRDVRFN